MTRFRTETFDTRQDWVSGRRISASRMPAIMGVSKWASPYSVWCELTGRVLPDEQYNPIRFRVGHALEGLIGELYEEHTRREVFPESQLSIQVHDTYPYLTCTLDFTVIDYKLGKGCLNAKTAIAQKAEDWAEGCPKDYWIQSQHECCVTGRAWASVAVLVGNNTFRYVDIPRDNEFIDEHLLPCAHKFWSFVQCDIAPPVDFHEATAEALARAYPESDGTVIELPAAFADIDIFRECGIGLIATTQEDVNTATNRIKQYMGSAETAILPGVAKYTWRLQKTSNGSLARVFRRKELSQ